MWKLALGAIVLVLCSSTVGWTQDTKDPPKLWIQTPRITAPIKPEISVTLVRGQESVSGPTQLEVELEVKRAPLNVSALLGQKVTVGMRLSNGAPRYFSGYVESIGLSSVEHTSAASRPAGKRTFRATYNVKVIPWLGLLRKIAGFAIYQDLTVPQVIKKVFARKGFSMVWYSKGGMRAPAAPTPETIDACARKKILPSSSLARSYDVMRMRPSYTHSTHQ